MDLTAPPANALDYPRTRRAVAHAALPAVAAALALGATARPAQPVVTSGAASAAAAALRAAMGVERLPAGALDAAIGTAWPDIRQALRADAAGVAVAAQLAGYRLAVPVTPRRAGRLAQAATLRAEQIREAIHAAGLRYDGAPGYRVGAPGVYVDRYRSGVRAGWTCYRHPATVTAPLDGGPVPVECEGLVTLSSGPADPATGAHPATWIEQGRGYDLRLVSGWVAPAPSGGWYHARTAAQAARGAARRARAASAPARPARAPTAATLAVSVAAGNCAAGTRAWAERWLGPDVRRVTRADLEAAIERAEAAEGPQPRARAVLARLAP